MHGTAIEVLHNAGVILCPTETLPGLSCLPDKLNAVQRLLNIKQRSADKGLILIAANLHQFEPWILPLDRHYTKTINEHSSDPTTWLVPARESVSKLIRGQFSTLAIRLTTHPTCLALCQQINAPLISTSANISQHQAAVSMRGVPENIRSLVDVIVEGADGTGKPSRIINIKDANIIR